MIVCVCDGGGGGGRISSCDPDIELLYAIQTSQPLIQIRNQIQTSLPNIRIQMCESDSDSEPLNKQAAPYLEFLTGSDTTCESQTE
ncbi:hypothetical protein Tco_0863224 [Tanacetum coccineum]